jgi:hypothetical protein
MAPPLRSGTLETVCVRPRSRGLYARVQAQTKHLLAVLERGRKASVKPALREFVKSDEDWNELPNDRKTVRMKIEN